MSHESTEFEKRSREVLEESSGRLDGRTLSRLSQARHAALEKLQRPARALWWRWSVPASAAAAAVLAVVMWVGRPPTLHDGAGPSVDDFELLTDADAPDFVNDGEDVDFYEWAAGEMES